MSWQVQSMVADMEHRKIKNYEVVLFFIKKIWQKKKGFYFMFVLSALIQVTLSWLVVIVNKYLFDSLAGGDFLDAFCCTCLLLFGTALLNSLGRAVDFKINIYNMELVKMFEGMIAGKISEMEYERLEDSRVMEQKERALEPITQRNMLYSFIVAIKSMGSAIIMLFGMGGLMAYLNVWLVCILLVIVFFNTFIYKKSQEANNSFWKAIMPLNRKLKYFRKLANDYKMGTDVRIYQMQDYILKKINSFDGECYQGFRKLYTKVGLCQGGIEVSVQFQMLVIYAYILSIVSKGVISIGDFTMYIAASQNFASSISNVLTIYMNIQEICGYLSEYISFMNIGDIYPSGNREITEIGKVEIRFENVWFKYANQEDYALRGVNVSIRSGEKVAIIGENGAGKSTFIKLLCRLYTPCEGTIRLNGVDICQYDRDEYMSLLSVVFQDYKIFDVSVRENIAVLGRDESNIKKAAIRAGIFEKIKLLENGMDSMLERRFNGKGIEFSGGENQKLAIARALYKDAPIVILDEPTSALDPIAEYETYERFHELTKNKTTIFVSHRMSACRFCDRVLLFDDGSVYGEGTHDSLLKHNEFYCKMWNAQAHFYE